MTQHSEYPQDSKATSQPATPVDNGNGNGQATSQPAKLTPAEQKVRNEAIISELAAMMRLLRTPDQVTELRILEVATDFGRPFTKSGFYDYQNIEKMCRDARMHSGKAKGIYYTLNPLIPELLARRNNRTSRADGSELANDKNVLGLRLALLDVDSVRPISGVSATENEKTAALKKTQEIRAFLKEKNWPDPVFIDSGNGFANLYRIDLPTSDCPLVKSFLLALDHRFSDDTARVDTAVYNPSRIHRFPGTKNCKGDHTNDRPHRYAKFLEIPGYKPGTAEFLAVPRELLEEIAAEASDTTRPKAAQVIGAGWTAPSEDRSKIIERAGKYLAKVPPAISGQGGHKQTFHAACVLVIGFGLIVEEALPVLQAWNESCQPLWEEKDLIHKLEDANKQPGPRGKLLGSDPPGKATRRKQKSRAEKQPNKSQDPFDMAGVPQAEANDDASPDSSGKPIIVVDERQLRDICSDAENAISAANNPPKLFERGGQLARLRLNQDTSGVSVEILDNGALRGYMARVADWVEDSKTERKNAIVPMSVVEDFASLPSWNVPSLKNGVVATPFFNHNGELINSPGYHQSSATWLQPSFGLAIQDIPDRPSQEDINRARTLLLDELFGDFPFKDESSKAHALVALLLPFIRQMIDGPTPLHLFDAPVEGTGKTLLVNVITTVSTEDSAGTMPETISEEEWRKRITATLLEAPIFFIVDNINRILDSSSLANALTSKMWKDRILGISKTVTVANKAVWIGTGNNVVMTRELIRRTIWIRLDANVDAPWTRNGFRHSDLTTWAKSNRGQLVWAALTLCQAWIASGRPQGVETLGMYESWAQTMGGILAVAGVPGLLANAALFRAAAGDKADEWRCFVAAWWQHHADKAVGVHDLFTLATSEKLLDRVLGDREERSQRTRLGIALGKMVDRVFGDYQIKRGEPDHKERQRYQLIPVKKAQTKEQKTQEATTTEEVGEWTA